MSALTKHSHEFPSDEWPFADSNNAPAFSTIRVTKERRPILTVFHDHNGDWQFHCGFIEDNDEPTVFCLGCIYQLDSSVGMVADLPAGWMASRETIESPWKREPFEENGDDDGSS